METNISQDFRNHPTALFLETSTLVLDRDASRDHTDNSKPDRTANNDNGVDCRMHCFWMGHQIFQHSPPSICGAFGSTSSFPGQASSAALHP